MCGVVVEEDTLMCLRRVQIEVNRHKETAITCIWVTNGIDHCRIGFLKRHMHKNSWRFDGALAQVTKTLATATRQIGECTTITMVVHSLPSCQLYLRGKHHGDFGGGGGGEGNAGGGGKEESA